MDNSEITLNKITSKEQTTENSTVGSMPITKISLKKISTNKDFCLPELATIGSAGMDLRADINEATIIASGESLLVKTGFAIALPIHLEAQIRPRSGLALKHGITVLNSPGTIDSDYRGEICIILINHSNKDFLIEPNMRIAQMVINKVEKVQFEIIEELPNSKRGSGGFGSSGTK